MSGSALVPVKVFSGKGFTRPDIQMMWLVYHTFDKSVANSMYPERVRAYRANSLLFQNWFPGLAELSIDEIEEFVEDIAEDAIMYEALQRLRDPQYIRKEKEAIAGFFAWLEHEPPEPLST